MNLRGGGNVAYEHVRVVIDVPCPCCTGARSRHYPRECGVDGACTYPRECVRECGVDGACTWHCAGRSARLPLTRMSGTHPSPRLHQARPGALRDPACIRATIEWTRDRLETDSQSARARGARAFTAVSMGRLVQCGTETGWLHRDTAFAKLAVRGLECAPSAWLESALRCVGP